MNNNGPIPRDQAIHQITLTINNLSSVSLLGLHLAGFAGNTNKYLPRNGQGTYDEHNVTKGTDPAQGFKNTLLQEGFTASIPHTFAQAGMELNKPDWQQTGYDHAHQAQVQAPESGFHQTGTKHHVWTDITQDQ